MPTGPRFNRLLATLVVVVALACSDSLAPGELGQAYRLVSVVNDVLPTALYTTESGTLRILSQTSDLVLKARARSLRRRSWCHRGQMRQRRTRPRRHLAFNGPGR